MQSDAIVYIVDDDAAVRHSLDLMMQSMGLNAKSYASAQQFLEDYDKSSPGCLVLDIRMPNMSGLELQEELARLRITIPVIIITGHGDVPLVVRAMKAGAMDFLEKPFHDQDLLDGIARALAMSAEILKGKKEFAIFNERVSYLSPREKEVMDMLVTGNCSKEIASMLGISPKTVDVHRSHIMEKMQVRSVIELVHLALSEDSKKVVYSD